MHKTPVPTDFHTKTPQVIEQEDAMRVVVAAARKYSAGNTTTFPSFFDCKKIKCAIEILEGAFE